MHCSESEFGPCSITGACARTIILLRTRFRSVNTTVKVSKCCLWAEKTTWSCNKKIKQEQLRLALIRKRIWTSKQTEQMWKHNTSSHWTNGKKQTVLANSIACENENYNWTMFAVPQTCSYANLTPINKAK